MPFDPTSADIRTDQDEAIELDFGVASTPDVRIQKVNDTGVVTIEFYDFIAEDWYLPTEAENNISDRGVATILGGYRVPMRIQATAGAVYVFVGRTQS